ncbi:DUF4190 domain-containing protein [Micromonospora endophytica]|uniref:DUF4190 domain-containing protein n=1 Tax=Micromonospora endophytica TaxID=515350 RepID=A0A2W2BZY6_9ACTN|nr:DUF4190 domain-containing protein [Micromonospora endophytica]PZF86024.1 hypothetical protein C1I93_28080 [Micromonospora endophytica]
MNSPSVVHVAGRTSGKAVASMVVAIIGALGASRLFGIPSFIAVLLGHLAMPETMSGAFAGRAMAITGVILGYLADIPWLIFTLSSPPL